MASIIYMTDFSESYARGMLIGMAKYANDTGEAWNICRLPLSVRDQFGTKEVAEYAYIHHADAIVGQFNPDDDVEIFAEKGIIALSQDYKSPFDTIPNIKGMYKKSGEIAAKYFIDKGFKNFAFYGMKNVIWSEERRSGFLSTIISLKPDFSYSELEMTKREMWNYDIKDTAEWLISLPKPVSIMACDDNHAYFIAETCRIMGLSHGKENLRIPEDIALLGVDNDETICKLSPVKLSSIGQDVERAGYEVAKYIDRSIKHLQEPIKDITVPVTGIITRQSSDILVNDDPFIATVLKYIHNNIRRKISVDEIVEQVPLSRRLLESKFKKIMGQSIYNYIISIKIQHTAQMISSGSTVYDAAFEFGFGDIKNFSRVFKKIKGVSPTEYRVIN